VNDRILTAYRETAAAALDYADPDRAVATARRRRRTRVAALVPVIAAVLGAGFLLRPEPAPPATTAISVADPVLLAAPSEPEPLPRGATGPATLVYTPCFSDCDALVALTDGRQFAVPRDPAGAHAGRMSLSPGGSWLGYPHSGEYLVRDLTGTTLHRIRPAVAGHRVDAAAWSADATKLVLAEEPGVGGDATYRLLDLTTGATTNLPIPHGHQVAGLLPDGAALHVPLLSSGDTLPLTATDGHVFPIALGGKLAAGELAWSVHLARNGTDVWIVVGTAQPDIPAAVDKTVAIILATLSGRALARYDLPATGLWDPLGPADDGFILSHRPDAADRPQSTLVTVSGAGIHEGLTIPGKDGGPVVRIAG
jgi:hypothetical protein